MGVDNLSDIVINGSGTASGGHYGRVQINGSGKITGDIECGDFSINGSGSAAGAVKAERLHISGSGRVIGDVEAGELKASGSAHFEGNVSGGSVGISGSGHIHGSVKVEEIHISGSAKIDGDCNAEHFRASGAFTVGGLLSADEVDIRLYSHYSHVREIGGSKIRIVREEHPGFAFLQSVFSLSVGVPCMETESIEGDEIVLEYTKAKMVRGGRVSIGPGCDIGEVEYTESYEKDNDAQVGSEKKV